MSGSHTLYIGDEVSASGYRLAGLKTCTPSREQLRGDIDSLIGDAVLVLVSAEMAAELSDTRRQQLLARVEPPVVVVPDVRGRHAPEDLATYLRKQLGVLE